MPYIDTYVYNDICIDPMAGESYRVFSSRITGALKTINPDAEDADIQKRIDRAWNSYVFNHATQLTLTLKKDIDEASIYNYSWTDWEIAEIHSATMPTVSFSAVEKAKAGTGDKFQISKSVEDKQMVFGWANIAKEANGSFPIDWDGDVTKPEDLEAAAYTFVLKYRATGEQHEGEAKGQLVESVMFTKEKQEALGIPEGIVPEGWWVGFHVPDKEVFAKIKSGEYEMFSVQGDARRVPTGQ